MADDGEKLTEHHGDQEEWSDAASILLGTVISGLGLEIEDAQWRPQGGDPPNLRIEMPPEVALKHGAAIREAVIGAFSTHNQSVNVTLVPPRAAVHSPGLVLSTKTGEPTERLTEAELLAARTQKEAERRRRDFLVITS